MKNAFYLNLKSSLVLKIFKFLPWPFGHVAKRLDQKDKVNLKICDLAAWLANNCNTHIAPNILRSKGNQTMKFDQFVEYNIRNIFLEKSYLKCGGETSLSSERSRLSRSLGQQSKVLYSLFLCYAKLRAIKIY